MNYLELLKEKKKQHQKCKIGGQPAQFSVLTIPQIKILVLDIIDDVKTLGIGKAPHDKSLFFS